VCLGPFFESVSPRPETISETCTNRLDKGLVWVVSKHRFKYIDIDRCVNCEKVRVEVKSFFDDGIIEFTLRRRRKRKGRFRPLSSCQKERCSVICPYIVM
jgi:hypothetical protein